LRERSIGLISRKSTAVDAVAGAVDGLVVITPAGGSTGVMGVFIREGYADATGGRSTVLGSG